ncbi:hypothetical protein [Allisonella histaminiformans]
MDSHTAFYFPPTARRMEENIPLSPGNSAEIAWFLAAGLLFPKGS